MNKVEFTSIKFKNFMSYGNAYTEFNFKTGMTLITGSNGFGKTTAMVALFYCLYGKSYKKNKLGSLINDVNNRELVVELNLQIGKDQYKVIRGQKPSIFEIYENDKLIPQNSTVAEYQDYFETYILKINENVFRQLIFLGANVVGSKSFIDLTKSEKEELFQIITDTSLFKIIKDSIKQKSDSYKTQQTESKYKVDVLTESLASEQNAIQQMEIQNSKINSMGKERITQIEGRVQEIDEKCDKIKEALKKMKTLKANYEQCSVEYSDLKTQIDTKTNLYNKTISELSKIDSTKSAFKECLGCAKLNNISKVDLSQEGRLREELSSYELDNEALSEKLNSVNETMRELRAKLDKGKIGKEQYDSLQSEKVRILSEADTIRTQKPIKIDYTPIEHKKAEISALKLSYEDFSTELTKLKTLDKLLSNDNLKGVIINQTLPLLNKLINEYILKFSDFSFNFYIDNNFKENVVLRGRDREFHSLSNGEGFRITFSIMFAFLKLVEQRNGVETNLLILDEVLDTSMDSNGRSELLNILKQDFADTKDVIIISHNPDIVKNNEYFDTIYRIEKVNNFSKIRED